MLEKAQQEEFELLELTEARDLARAIEASLATQKSNASEGEPENEKM